MRVDQPDSQRTGILIVPYYPPTAAQFEGFSHLGGLPSLPPSMNWPRNSDGVAFHFLGQIDLSELQVEGVVDHVGKLLDSFPKIGSLYFFANCAGDQLWSDPQNAHRVIYFPEAPRDLLVTPAPTDLPGHNANSAHSVHALPDNEHRQVTLLPHVPLRFAVDAESVLSDTDLPWPWTGSDAGARLAEALGFPWRWIALEKIACHIADACTLNALRARLPVKAPTLLFGPSWPPRALEASRAWIERGRHHAPLELISAMERLDFLRWLSVLDENENLKPYLERCLTNGVRAAWPYIAFGGELSDIPSEIIEGGQPWVRPTLGNHHKMFGSAVSVQNVQLADADNILLLRLGSDIMLDFCWGDVGVLQITMRKDDMAARNFSRTALNADCG
jgi:uncharacterized protein YwqG